MIFASGGFASTRLLPGNVVEAALDKPGTYSVSMVAFETVDGRQVPHRFDWGKVEVLDAEGVQSFAIELAPDDVTRLAELRERLQAK
ncbi:MAG: hypothetical protein JNK15_12845 [Planctomycetes bacterium]|nr:hypothetical protein [Planctomycetota bacterium]